ncbi:hypothetical protein [Bacillus sp. FJAT-49736]|uniref:hypothetical protein n=1 Tax=Bacillus sp. FJAT-49736 TaxID=2833582 RepID=UPI001BCA0C09|nr:hypothetical protein [Bacillus sp. FJAT-49736]MBS4175100.1 hypothetical protein [Bacillus sp. FJAT-49736]
MKNIKRFSILILSMLVCLLVSFNSSNAASAMTSVSIAKGKSYEFSNISKKSGDIKVVGGTDVSYDYVVYDKSGNVVDTRIAEWIYTTIKVPSGGKLIMTGQSKKAVKAGGASKQFKGKTSKSPALTRSTIVKGKSYEFSNTSKKSGKLKVVGGIDVDYDYVVYDKSGNVMDTRIAEWINTTVTVPAGGKVTMTGQSKKAVIAGGANKQFKGKASKLRALTRSTIVKGKSYEFSNTSKKLGKLKVIGGIDVDYDYVVYDKNGNVVDTRIAEWINTTVIVPASGKLIMTVQSKKSVIAGGSSKIFKGNTGKTPALTRSTMVKGKSYEFFNKSNKEGKVKVVGGIDVDYDYVVYDKNGNVLDTRIAEWINTTVTVPAGGKLIITGQSKKAVITGGSSKIFKGNTGNSPALTRATIANGKSYEFSNKSNLVGNVKVVGGINVSYDYVVYNVAGDVVKSDLAQWINKTIEVPANGTLVITVQGKNPAIAGGSYIVFAGKAI